MSLSALSAVVVKGVDVDDGAVDVVGVDFRRFSVDQNL